MWFQMLSSPLQAEIQVDSRTRTWLAPEVLLFTTYHLFSVMPLLCGSGPLQDQDPWETSARAGAGAANNGGKEELPRTPRR